MEMRYICIHHFGPKGSDPMSKTSSQTEREINEAHKIRWPDFPSQLNGSFIGYNFIIWPDGTIKQYRYIGEETAAQKGHNFDAISICLAGNFTKGVELPTLEQKIKLRGVLQAFINGFSPLDYKGMPGTTVNVAKERILPHRILQPNHTECYGSALSDTWAQDLISTSAVPSVPSTPIIESNEKRDLMTRMISLLKQVGQLLQELLRRKNSEQAPVMGDWYDVRD
jgi:hypothetical protein